MSNEKSGFQFLRFALCAAVFLAQTLSCGDYSNEDLVEDLAFLRAIPDRAALELRVSEPDSRWAEMSSSQSTLILREDALLGETAIYYLFSSALAQRVNREVFGFIDFVDWITAATAPAVRSEDRRVWGPWLSGEAEDTDVRFVMTRGRDSGLFLFFYQVRDVRLRDVLGFDEAWADCIYGQFEPADGGWRLGKGNLTVDQGVCARDAESDARGTARVDFETDFGEDPLSGKTQLEIVFDDFLSREQIAEQGERAQALQGTYLYVEDESERRFEFSALSDMTGEPPAESLVETVSMVVIWDSEGRGRAEAVMSSGDLGLLVVEASECWDESWARVYYEDSHELASSEGSPEACFAAP